MMALALHERIGMELTYDDIAKVNDVESIFMSLVARNNRYYNDRHELYEIVTGSELMVIADAFFDGRINVAMAFMQSDDATRIAVEVDRKRRPDC